MATLPTVERASSGRRIQRKPAISILQGPFTEVQLRISGRLDAEHWCFCPSIGKGGRLGIRWGSVLVRFMGVKRFVLAEDPADHFAAEDGLRTAFAFDPA